MMTKNKSLEAKDIEQIFAKIDDMLALGGKKLSITVLGGVAIILQNVRQRATLDIDLSPSRDAESFRDICKELGIPVDIVTMVSTVDLNHCETIINYSGKFLTVRSVSPINLIKSKLERYTKQDPEDIFSIIEINGLSYTTFKGAVSEMLVDFVGRITQLKLSALEVVERKYPDQLTDFEDFIGL